MTLEEQLKAAKKELNRLDGKYIVCQAQNGDFAEGTMKAYADLDYLKDRVAYLKKQIELKKKTASEETVFPNDG